MKNNNIPQTLNDIILFNQNHAKEALKYGQNGLTYVQNNSSGTMTEPEYIKAILKREELIQRFDNIFTENKIDVMFCLAGTGLPAMTGFPGMTIPVGMDKNNLPVGSFWVARRYDEATLFRVTYVLEQILGLCLKP